jgi:Ca2+-binding RTX toxin-like protein
LSGNGAANYFSSGLGNDSLLGGGGNDTLYAGYWSDTAEDDDWVDGGAGNDYLYGGSGVDRFVFSVAAGEANADFIDGFTSGEDQLRLDPAAYTQLGASGRFGWGDERFYAAAGASSGHDASDRLIFDTTNGYFYYDADGSGAGAALRIATLWGPLQATDIYVGFGEDTGSIRGTSGNDTLVGTSGDDLIEGFGGNDSIEGLGGRDGLLGGSGNDNLSGGAGADSLDGGLGSDTMAGGLDDDIFIVDSFGDVVTEFAGGGANDEVKVSFSYSLPAWVENLTFTGSASTVGDGNNLDNIVAGNGAANTLRGGLGNDTISGEAGSDWLYGEGGDDVLRGGTDGDQLIGGDGNDFLEGGDGLDALYGQAGNDTLHGGAGDDYFFMLAIPGDYGNDVIDGGAGRDILMFDFGYAESGVVVDFAAGTVTGGGPGGSGRATVMNVEQVQATPFADRLTGGSGDDILSGMDGNDTLTGAGGDNSLGGGRGADLMTGGDGNDTMHGNGSDATEADGAVDTMIGGLGDDLYYASSEDVISDSGGIDGVLAYESWTLADDFENLYFAPGDFSGIGNSKDNWIAAGTGAQWLDGRAGNDTVSGGEGNDTLLGDLGNDFLSAGFGIDRLAGGAGNDTMTGLTDANTLAYAHFGAADADVIREFHLGSNSIELDGVAFTNIGPSGRFASSDARFHAAPGAAGGHDVDDRVIYNTTTGQLWYDADGSGSGGAQLIATLEGAPSLSASQISVINGRVSPAGQVINGTSGADTLADTAGNDTINGLAGNDTINGGTGGSDVVNGGDGRDSLAFMTATSAVVVDFVAGTAGNTSFTNIERAITGDFNDQLTGNASAQNLTARAGSDTLAGGGGIDTLWGGAGADTFIFREAGTANADTIADWTSGSDEIALDNAIMNALGADGDFVAGDARFWASSTGTAHDANDRVLYNTNTRSLYYDADGTGSGAAQLIATVQAGATIAATDISII